jgi:hypothetical protein
MLHHRLVVLRLHEHEVQREVDERGAGVRGDRGDQGLVIEAGISAVVSGVAANLVRGRHEGTWSISCSEPWPQRMAGARPPITSIGERFCIADVIALMPFVTPGPAVSAQTPGSRVTLAQPSAANAADASWRTSTMSMPSSRQPS